MNQNRNTMSRRILDSEEVILYSIPECYEFWGWVYKNQEIALPFINECGAVYIPNNMFTDDLCQVIQYIRNSGAVVESAPILPDMDVNRECIEGNGIFLLCPVKNKYRTLPTAEQVFINILQRAGDDCPTMRRFVETSKKGVKPTEEKVKELSKDLGLYAGSCLVLIRWGKVRAMLSDSYVVLKADDLLREVVHFQEREYPDGKFVRGVWSHDLFKAEFELNDELREDEFRLKLENFNVFAKKVKAKMLFYTSDTGTCSACCRCYYDIDGSMFLLPGKVEMPHTGEATVKKFGESVDKYLKKVFAESEEAIERLGNIPVNDPAGTLLRIQKKYSFINKELAGLKASEMAGRKNCTAIDVYIALNEVVQAQLTRSGASVRDAIDANERLLSLMFLPYRSIDNNEDW